MELRNWKRILLQWINQCGFVERSFFNIEQSDIEIFFKNICIYHIRARQYSKQTLKYNVMTFLKDNYPKFEYHLDDENLLSSADYVYLYSLLLHFCCVKEPEPYFHDICKKLPEQTQQVIASFLKEMVEYSVYTRETVRLIIGNLTLKFDTNAHLDESLASSNGSSHSNHNVPSPNSRLPITPSNKITALQRFSPTTPKTVLLEERTREVYNLKAQIETERYEKGLLELQIKQNDDKITKLNQDHRKLLNQIQEMKNEMLLKSSDNNSSISRDSDEQIKRRLCKEISQKEQEISKLTDILSGLNEENHLVEKKLSYSERKIVASNERIKELEIKVDELTMELEQKNDTIKYLTNNKLELEQFIAETRSASSTSRPDLNMSIDCLDASFSRTTNSSSSVNSPENLGCSVIDVQLREKEHENVQLREELLVMRTNITRYANSIRKLTLKKSEEYQLGMGEVIVKEDELNDPEHHIQYFSICMDRLGDLYKNETNKVLKLKDEISNAEDQNNVLTKKIDDFQKEVNMLNDVIHRIEKINNELEKSQTEMQEKLTTQEHDIKTLNSQKFDLVSKLESLANEFDLHMENCKHQQKELTEEKSKLQIEIQERSKKGNEMSMSNSQLKEEIHLLQNKMHSLQEKLITRTTESDLQIAALNDEIVNQRVKLENYQSTEQLLKEKCEKLLVQVEGMKREARETDIHLELMRNEIAMKESQMSSLGVEIVEVSGKNSELEQRIDKLINQFKNEKQSSDMALNKRDEHIKKIENEKTDLQVMLKNAQFEFHKAQQEHARYCDEMKLVLQKIEAINKILNITVLDDTVSNLEMIAAKVRDLQIHKMEAANQIECLEFDNLENNTIMKMIEEQLQKDLADKDELIKKHIEDMTETKIELQLTQNKVEDYEQKIDKLKRNHMAFMEKIENEMHMKEDNFHDRLTSATNDYEIAVQQLRHELNIQKEVLANKEIDLISERNDRVSKERELILHISEQNEQKIKLNEYKRTVNQLQDDNSALENNYNDKINNFETQIDKLTADNTKLIDDIHSFKIEQAKTEERLQDANIELKSLIEQLSAGLSNMLQMKIELKANEEIILQKANTIKELELVQQEQFEKLNKAEIEINDLEKLKLENNAKIIEFETKISTLTKEKEHLMQQQSTFSANILIEQQKKSALLKALERSVEEFKNITEEKDKKLTDLENNCENYQLKLNEANLLNTNVQAQLLKKSEELRLIVDEQQNERNTWENKLSDIMRKMAKQSEEIESYETALIEILTILESTSNLAAPPENDEEMRNAFGAAIETDINTYPNQLKQMLNRVLYNVESIQKEFAVIPKKENFTDYVDTLTKANGLLNSQVMRYKVELEELQEKLKTNSKSIEKKLNNEIKRLNDDSQNLINVNEKLSDEISILHEKLMVLEEENVYLKNEFNLIAIDKKNAIIERDQQRNYKNGSKKKIYETLKEREATIVELKEKFLDYQTTINIKQTNVNAVENEMHAVLMKLKDNETFINDLQNLKVNIQNEYNKVMNNSVNQIQRCRHLEVINMKLEIDVTAKEKEIITLKHKMDDVIKSRQELDIELKRNYQKVNENINTKRTNDTKFDNLQKIQKQLEHELDVVKVKNETFKTETKHLHTEIDELKLYKIDLINELAETKRELQRANDNVTVLIKQMKSLRTEKDTLNADKNNFKKQIDDYEQAQIVSEKKLNELVQCTGMLEQRLLSNECELKKIRENLCKSNANEEKLEIDNKKLRETIDTLTKRIEKQALKLGDAQARCIKFERDNEKSIKIIDLQKTSIDNVQREKDTLQNEIKLLKDRTNKFDRTHEQLMSKLQSFEKQNIYLCDLKDKLESSENEYKTKIIRLEKMKEEKEDKLRLLNTSLIAAENENVRLNLEIGGLNSKILELKKIINERNIQMEDIKNNLDTVQQGTEIFEKVTNELKMETEKLRAQNTEISDELSKVSLSLKIAENDCEKIKLDFQVQGNDLYKMREEKEQIEQDLIAVNEKLKDIEEENLYILNKKKNNIRELESKINELNVQLEGKCIEIAKLNNDLLTLRTTIKEKIEIGEDVSVNIDALKTRLLYAENMLQKEQKLTTQLRLDNQVLQIKYRETKQRIIDEVKSSEDRIRDNRLEMEGKLEKMKNKMTQCNMHLSKDFRRGTWKSRMIGCFKYLVVVVFSQAFFLIFLNYIVSTNEMEILLKSNKPSVF